ncbi:MAG: alpha-amylase family glycosyl hydrolase [Elusimicrobiota bacterium]|jgi:glycosidase
MVPIAVPGRLRQMRALLSLGTRKSDGSAIAPFVFRIPGRGQHPAPSAGLEGFIHAEERLRREHGRDAMLGNLAHYSRYLDDLLAAVPWTRDVRELLRHADHDAGTDAARYERLLDAARSYTDTLRCALSDLDAARWIRRARIYQLFPRAYNLAGRRTAYGRPPGREAPFFKNINAQDLADIKALGFDTIWPMGIFPIGQRNRSGTGGGSPYSIFDHAALEPELGSREDFRAFVALAHSLDMNVIIDFVPNHTSMDSALLKNHPEFFIHKQAPHPRPAAPDPGWFEHRDPGTGRWLWVRHGGYGIFGRVDWWNDTAQLDYSQPGLRREMTSIVRGWVDEFGVDGFRVDMAYLDLNANFSRTWGARMPETEFMDELLTAVKSAHPGTAFIAEGYDNWDELSACGFDLIYSKNNMDRPGGHIGWYDALQSRDPGWIRAALERAEYLHWQVGGADMLAFIGNHDEAAPARAFGPWLRGASLLTLLLPGSQLFYGSQEVGFDHPAGTEPKSIPFGVPVQVDWREAVPDITQFFHAAMYASRAIRSALDGPRLRVLRAAGSPDWVGYALFAPGGSRPELLVLANPTDHAAIVDFQDPSLGPGWIGSLPPFGYTVVQNGPH